MRPDQLGGFAVPSDPRLNPDGERIAFLVTQMDLEEDRYLRRIWLWDGSSARPLTSGPADTSPRWSPDGKKLAFLRKVDAEDGKPQVAVLDMAGGEAEVITDFPLGAMELEWSPDGSQIGIVAAQWIDELADVDPDERKRRPRRITRFPYRFDNMGWVGDRRLHIHVLDVATGTTEQITDGDYNERGISWHPEGDRLAFVSARHESRGLDPASQIWTVAVSGGELESQTDLGLWMAASFDPAGSLYGIGIPDVWGHPDVAPLYRIEPGGALTNLTGHLDRNIAPHAPTVSPPSPQWLADGRALVTVESSGSLSLHTMADDGVTTE